MKRIMILLISIFAFSLAFGQGNSIRLAVPSGHSRGITSAKYSPDGTKIITSSKDNSLKVWDAKNGKILYSLEGTGSVEFSPNSRLIATYSSDFTVKIWEVKSGNLIHSLIHHSLVFSIKFSSNGEKIITSSFDKTSRIWDVQSGYLLHALEHKEIVSYAEFSPDGKMAVTNSGLVVNIWHTNTGHLIRSFKDISGGLSQTKFSPDGEKIIAITGNNFLQSYTVHILNVNSGRLIKELKGHKYEISYAEYSKDGSKIVTASNDGTAIVWNSKTGRVISTMEGHTRVLQTAKFSPDGTKIVTASFDGSAKIWNVKNGKLLQSLEGHSAEVRCAEFSPDGKRVITSASDVVTGNKDIFSKIWDVNSGELLLTLKGYTEAVLSAEFSQNNDYIYLISKDHTAKKWSIKNLKLSHLFEGGSDDITSFQISSDEKIMITTHQSENIIRTAKLWDVINGSLIRKLDGYNYQPHSVKFSPDGKKILKSQIGKIEVFSTNNGELIYSNEGRGDAIAFSPDGKKIIYDFEDHAIGIVKTENGELIKMLNGHDSWIHSMEFSIDGTKIISSSNNNPSVKIWDAENGKLLYTISDLNGEILNVVFSSDNRKILVATSSFIKVWDIAEKEQICSLKEGFRGHTSFADLSPDGTKILISSEFEPAEVWSIDSCKLLYTLDWDAAQVNSIKFSSDSSKILTTHENGSFIIWDANNGRKIAQTFFFNQIEFLTLLPNNYYMATPKAATLLYYIKGDQTIGFDQLDVKYNRPDKVLEAIGAAFGNPDKNLIESYRKAYEKRIKKLGIDTTSFESGFSIPESDFKNRDVIEYEQSGNQLTLKVWGKDEDYQIDRYNVWVNEVPVFGEKGINVRNKNLNEINETVTITLSDGDNRIETSIMNVNGIESYRIPLYVRYEPKQPSAQKLYYVGIGVNQYQQSENNLNFSVPDIEDLSKAFKEKYGANIEVHTLLNDKVTVENVLALKDVLMKTTVNDKVIISFSGHGLLDDEFDYYLATHDIDFKNPKLRGLSYEALESLLDGIPARKKLLMIDACHSGEVDKDELIAIQNLQNKPGIKGAKVVAYKGSGLGLKNSFELMQEVFVNVNRGTGATVISASGGTQFAYEGKGLTNGVFTYSILEMMKAKNEAKVSELKTRVGERVEQLTDGLQKPTSRNETVEFDWEVW